LLSDASREHDLRDGVVHPHLSPLPSRERKIKEKVFHRVRESRGRRERTERKEQEEYIRNKVWTRMPRDAAQASGEGG
jgi:hypothetical protein